MLFPGHALAMFRRVRRGVLVTEVVAHEPVDGAPIALGRPAGTYLPDWCHIRLGRWRAQILIEGARKLCSAAPLDKVQDLQHPHPAIECDGEDVTGPHRLARGLDARTVDPHMAGARELRGRRTRAHDAGMPQPLVNTLAVRPQFNVAPWRLPRVAP